MIVAARLSSPKSWQFIARKTGINTNIDHPNTSPLFGFLLWQA